MITEDWIPAFRHPSYLRMGNALVFKVHNAPEFKSNCGSNSTVVKQRLDLLRSMTRHVGLGEILIGGGSVFDDTSDPSVWWGYAYNFTNMYCGVANDEPSFTGQVLPWFNESRYVNSWIIGKITTDLYDY